MKKYLAAAVVVVGALSASTSFAVDSVGCGLGAMAWKGEQGMAPQILAATTNMSFGTQTFGISSGTSGCDPNGRVTGGTGKMSLSFIENNMEQFAMDASRGQGETIDTLAGILNVDNKVLGDKVKQNFATLFANPNAQAVDVTLALLQIAQVQA